MVNHFSIMLQRRLKEQEHGEEEEEEGEKGAKKKKKKKSGQGGDLRIHDLDDDLELSSDNSESSEGEGTRENLQILKLSHLYFLWRYFIFWLFLERCFEMLQTEKVGQKVRRRSAQSPRGKRRKRRRVVMWRDMRTVMMETLKVWKWTTYLMRAGNRSLLKRLEE